jgi:hypothetical protein
MQGSCTLCQQAQGGEEGHVDLEAVEGVHAGVVQRADEDVLGSVAARKQRIPALPREEQASFGLPRQWQCRKGMTRR